MADTTCGILFFNGQGEILLGKVPNALQYDIPKGKREDNESEVEAAIRECYEETGIEVREEDLELLGNFPYRKGKNMTLFIYTGHPIAQNIFTLGLKQLEDKLGFLRELESVEYVPMDVFAQKVKPRMMRCVGRALAAYALTSVNYDAYGNI